LLPTFNNLLACLPAHAALVFANSIGRGLFQILAGFCLVVLSPILAKIIGAVTIGCGFMQVCSYIRSVSA
jgi:hypothetical protein